MKNTNPNQTHMKYRQHTHEIKIYQIENENEDKHNNKQK